MGLIADDNKKPGMSNPVAKEQGYPTSGSMQANAGTTPPQLQQAPYQQFGAGGGLSGKAVQGSQWKTQASPMSGGVASYVGIPSHITAPQQPAASFIAANNGGGFDTKYGALDSGQGQPPNGFQPQKWSAPGNGQPAGPSAQFAPNPPKWTPLNDIAQMQHYYDRGGDFDVQARRAMQDQFANSERARQAQSALAGRGLGVGDVESQSAQLSAMGNYEGQRAGMEQQAQQQAFGNQMAYSQLANSTKMQLAAMAKDLGLTFDDQAYNQMASEMVAQTGQTPSTSEMLAQLTKHGGAPGSTGAVKSQQISSLLDSYAWNKEENAAELFEQMTDEEARQFAAQWPNTYQRLLSETWRDTHRKVVAKALKAGLQV